MKGLAMTNDNVAAFSIDKAREDGKVCAQLDAPNGLNAFIEVDVVRLLTDWDGTVTGMLLKHPVTGTQITRDLNDIRNTPYNIAQPEPADAVEHVFAIAVESDGDGGLCHITSLPGMASFPPDAPHWQPDAGHLTVLPRMVIKTIAGRIVSQDGVELCDREPYTIAIESIRLLSLDVNRLESKLNATAKHLDTAQRELGEANQRCANQATTIQGHQRILDDMKPPTPDEPDGGEGQQVEPDAVGRVAVHLNCEVGDVSDLDYPRLSVNHVEPEQASIVGSSVIEFGTNGCIMSQNGVELIPRPPKADDVTCYCKQCEQYAAQRDTAQRELDEANATIDELCQITPDEPDGGNTITLTEAGELAIASEHAIEQAKSDGRADVLALWERAIRSKVQLYKAGEEWLFYVPGRDTDNVWRGKASGWMDDDDDAAASQTYSDITDDDALPAALDALEGGG